MIEYIDLALTLLIVGAASWYLYSRYFKKSENECTSCASCPSSGSCKLENTIERIEETPLVKK
ncbi:FeoB-associated Cys-rich membrane protein [Limisalsivibrio acetivorans]|uniref:FeoB-associated Cys-rich membrane protein n=1 Tax=Limisalsivibrio acetivorans TaxID=1304888 RepID=UPI0003B68CBE|nr:FeoB-associated Cys-rich membrane protein [Limisalsivibrio acetivorans]